MNSTTLEHPQASGSFGAETCSPDAGVPNEAQPEITIEVRNGDETIEYTSYAALGHDLISGQLARATSARVVPATLVAEGGDREQIAWSDLGTIADADPRLRALYRPVWHHALKGAAIGALVGAGIKLLDTTGMLVAADERLLVLWLMTLASIVAGRWLPWLPFLIGFKFAAMGVPNLYVTALVSGGIGSLLGAPLGMAAGTCVGYLRRTSLPTAADATREEGDTAMWGLAVPLTAGVLLLATYVFVVVPWLADKLS